MPYGIKRGVKAPGEFGFSDLAGLALAGAAGIVAALITDYQQSGEAAALYTLNEWAVNGGRILGFGDIPLWLVVVGVVAVGAGSIFYFQPITRQGAFAQGFGLLAVITTAVPADLAAGLPAILAAEQDLPAPFETPEEGGGERVVDISYAARTQDARVWQVQDRRAVEARYDVRLVLNFEGDLPEDIDAMIRRGDLRGRLHNAESRQTYNLFRNAGADLKREGNRLYIDAGVPARTDTATLWIRVEAVGHQIEVLSTEATLGETLTWEINLPESSMPLFMQRFGKSYWF